MNGRVQDFFNYINVCAHEEGKCSKDYDESESEVIGIYLFLLKTVSHQEPGNSEATVLNTNYDVVSLWNTSVHLFQRTIEKPSGEYIEY